MKISLRNLNSLIENYLLEQMDLTPPTNSKEIKDFRAWFNKNVQKSDQKALFRPLGIKIKSGKYAGRPDLSLSKSSSSGYDKSKHFKVAWDKYSDQYTADKIGASGLKDLGPKKELPKANKNLRLPKNLSNELPGHVKDEEGFFDQVAKKINQSVAYTKSEYKKGRNALRDTVVGKGTALHHRGFASFLAGREKPWTNSDLTNAEVDLMKQVFIYSATPQGRIDSVKENSEVASDGNAFNYGVYRGYIDQVGGLPSAIYGGEEGGGMKSGIWDAEPADTIGKFLGAANNLDGPSRKIKDYVKLVANREPFTVTIKDTYDFNNAGAKQKGFEKGGLTFAIDEFQDAYEKMEGGGAYAAVRHLAPLRQAKGYKGYKVSIKLIISDEDYKKASKWLDQSEKEMRVTKKTAKKRQAAQQLANKKAKAKKDASDKAFYDSDPSVFARTKRGIKGMLDLDQDKDYIPFLEESNSKGESIPQNKKLRLNRSQLRKMILKEIKKKHNLLREASEDFVAKQKIVSFINAKLGSDFFGSSDTVFSKMADPGANPQSHGMFGKAYGVFAIGGEDEKEYQDVPHLLVDPPKPGEIVRIYDDEDYGAGMNRKDGHHPAGKQKMKKLSKFLQNGLPEYRFEPDESDHEGSIMIRVFNK